MAGPNERSPEQSLTTDSFLTGQFISTGLTTQIRVKVGNQTIGAIQSIRVGQTRGHKRVVEIGTDGVIEIVPNAAAQYTLTVTRIRSDRLSLYSAFKRGFSLVHCQRIPFDIEVFDFQLGSNSPLITTFKNCWFQSLNYTYGAEDYVISEEAEVWAETAKQNRPSDGGLRSLELDKDSVEMDADQGKYRGSLDQPLNLGAFKKR